MTGIPQMFKKPTLALSFVLLATMQSAFGQVVIENNPSIIALQESDPRSPEQLMFAIQVTYGFDRLDEMNKYVERIVAAGADDATKVALHRRFGSPLFIKLSDRNAVGDELADFAISVIEAAAADARRQDKLRQLAVAAQGDDEVARRAAVVELLKAGDVAAPVLLNAISQAETDVQRGRLETALVGLGSDAVGSLIAGIESDNAAVVTHSARALGRLDAQKAIPYLVGLALSETHPSTAAGQRALLKMVGVKPTLGEGVVLLRRKILAIRMGDLPERPDIDDMIRIFRWDNDANTVVISRTPREIARYDAAARLARDLAKLSDSPKDQLGAMLVQLQDAQLKAGRDQPLDRDSAFWKMATDTEPKELETLLVAALKRGWNAAATAAIEALGASGEVTLLESVDGRPRPLAAALTHPDRRVRYAATRAIMQLNPRVAFAGSSDLVDALEYFIQAGGARRVLVAHPNISNARTVVGLLRAQSFDGAAATTGRAAIQVAQDSPDIEMILLSSMLSRPSVGETMHLLRQDPRTSSIPIGIMAREDAYEDAVAIAAEDSMTVAMPRLHSVSAAAVHTARLLELSKDEPTQLTRIIQAQASLRILQKIAMDRERYGFYEVFRTEDALVTAVQQPALTETAAGVLGQLGTSRAQRVLMVLSLTDGVEDGGRLAAFQALRKAISLRGLQLTNAEIQEQQRQLRNAPLNDTLSKRIGDAMLKVFRGKPVDESTLQAAVSS